MSKAATIYSLCDMCGTRCPVEVTLAPSDTAVESLVPHWICGNRHSPSGTSLCPRGAAALSGLDDERRIFAPLIRQGPRGACQWREVSWDEALDHVAERLEAHAHIHGPHSLLWSERPGPHSALTQAFVRGMASPNFCTHNATCRHNVDEAAHSLTGRTSHHWLYDYARCKALVLQGRNLFEALGTAEVQQVLDALDAGCRLTVMDVRATVTAAKAQRFWLLRPGSDYALNLAVIHVLLRDALCPPTALDQLEGLEALRAFVRPYDPPWAAQQCDLADEGQGIETLARELAAAAPAVIWHPGWMASRYTQSLMLCRSAYIINALLGSFGSAGGLLPAPAPTDSEGRGLFALHSFYPAVTAERVDGVGTRYPHLSPEASLLPQALESGAKGDPYPIASYIAYRHDPLTSLPGRAQLLQWLEAIPLLVSMVPLWSVTAWHSDVVLPLASGLENDLPLMSKPGRIPTLYLPRRAVDPHDGCRPDWQVLSGLAKRLGLDKLAFDSAEALWTAQLAGSGRCLEDFSATGMLALHASPPDLPPLSLSPLPTPSGKLEVVSRRWSEAGVPSLQPWHSPACVQQLGGETAFRLVVGRVALHTQASTQNLAPLAAQFPENTAWIHPSRAHALHIEDGELVILEALDNAVPNSTEGEAAGEVPEENTRPLYIRVHVTPDIHPEALFMVHGFGHTLPMASRARGRGVADEDLMPQGLNTLDRAGLVPALQEHTVHVRKIHRELL